ncbi:hypothetical protein [Paenibacillus hamazuiensis]|uniref:hypothetical protein n=1 Tax=Paenibacillus hamazuiensis TaxID=2936508 RepID=UPI00200E3192|nr:hypothetical protein [Paenibacillus hamazuiensis]
MTKLSAVIAVLLVGTGLYTGAPLSSSEVSRTIAAAPSAEEIPVLAAAQHIPAETATTSGSVYAPAQIPAPVPSGSASADKPPADQPGTASESKQPAPSAPEKLADATTLEEAVAQWKQSLAKQKGFESWQKATWTSSTLGPGMHGWIVILKQGGSEVGYMVVHAASDGTLRLGEYGTGKYPLFSLNTLYKSLVQHELIDMSFSKFAESKELHGEKLYYNPLQAVWKVKLKSKTHLIDAKTGELLPVREAVLPSEASSAENGNTKTASSHTIVERLDLPAFDPYEKLPWVKGKPLEIRSFAELKERIAEKQKITYVGFLYGYEVTVPLAVTGYHAWSKDGYVLLDQDGLRAVDYETLPSSSRFYR